MDGSAYACDSRPSDRIVLSQLAGNALAKIAPGGGAAGGALQYRMLTGAGLSPAAVGGGLTSANLLTFATLLALPVLDSPRCRGGAPRGPRPRGMRRCWAQPCSWWWEPSAACCWQAIARWSSSAGSRRMRGTECFPAGRRCGGIPGRLVRERDVALRVIGRHKREALLSAVLCGLLDYSALLLALAWVGAEPRPSLVLLAFTASQLLAHRAADARGNRVRRGRPGRLARAGGRQPRRRGRRDARLSPRVLPASAARRSSCGARSPIRPRWAPTSSVGWLVDQSLERDEH